MQPNDVTWQELNDPWNEFGTLDFDADRPNNDADWWQQQDAELEAEELEKIEMQAEANELRHNGYWD
jgi:hypothetical protein